MRPEIKEYNLDWMLASVTRTSAAVLETCTEKEVRRMLRYTPNFEGLEVFLNQGKAGASLMRLVAQYMENLITAKDNGKKVVMSTFCFSPALFYAMDIVPVVLEVLTALLSLTYKRGAADYMDYCVELGFSETGCSSQRGSMGAYLAGLGVDIDFIAINTAGICDTNSNAFAFAAEQLNIPFYGLNYPASITGDDVQAYHRKDYRALISFLEEHSGKKFDIDRFRSVLEETRKQDALIDEMEEMQRLIPNPMPGIFNLFLYAGRFLFSGKEIYTGLLEEMAEAVRKNAGAGISGLSKREEKSRAFFMYIDNYAFNQDLWTWLDSRGVAHVGNILSRFFSDTSPYGTGIEGTTYHIDTTDLDSMIDSLADMNARMPMTRSIRGPYDAPHMWLEDCVSLVNMYKGDCCIYIGTPGCRNTWANVKLLARDLEKSGYPTHIVNSDAFDGRVESWETTAARLDEFFQVRGLL